MTGTNRVIHLARQPVGMVQDSDFELRDEPVPTPSDGDVLVRTRYLSLDPAIRGWMNGVDTYMPGIQPGDAMRGGGIGEVVESRFDGAQVGDLVTGMLRWSDLTAMPGAAVRVLPAQEPVTAFLSVFGTTGMTAYFGLLDVAPPEPGETVVVSGAAGAVRSVAGQIAKIKGARAVGIAGTAEKCSWVTDELGFDACINYRTDDLDEALRAACPDGIDVYFDNVGGEVLETVLGQINLHARISLCGAISQYNDVDPTPGPRNLFNLVIKRARMQGFILLDYLDRSLEAILELARWVQEGRIKYAEDVVDGLEHAPAAFRTLFTGENTGKLIVKVHD